MGSLRKEPFLIMAGDWGGAVYLTCPMRLVKCSEGTLRRVHAELEQLSGDEQEGRELRIEEHALGDGERMRFLEGLWLERWLADLAGLDSNVMAILVQGEEQRAVFNPSEKELLEDLGGIREDSFSGAALTLLALAGFHGHVSTSRDRSLWRADIYALRAGWEIGSSADADNLQIFANWAARKEQASSKFSDLLRWVDEHKEKPFVGSGSSHRFVLFS